MADFALTEVRKILKEKNIDAFIVGSGDAHQSEYVCDADMRRMFVTRFTGSAGTALILQDKALMWTDGRYFLHAEQELSPSWTLMKSGEPGVLELQDWLQANMKNGQSVGIDASLISTSQAKGMERSFAAYGIKLESLKENPVDIVWNATGERPAFPAAPILSMDIEKVGKSHQDKIKDIRAMLTSVGAEAMVVSMLDEICWLLNIRGGDIVYNPVAISYAVVCMEKTFLFVDSSKVSDAVRTHLGADVEIRPYDTIDSFLAELTTTTTTMKVMVDPTQLNWRVYCSIPVSSAVDKASPITMAKSIKNSAELEGVRQSHIRDGAALTAFLHWLETTVRANPFSITEYDAAMKVEEYRGKMLGHVGPSFATIAGYGPNSAIMHYRPEEATSSKIGNLSMFLLDSGAQYADGTTDVTRSTHFGKPTEKLKDCYTMVLKGHIALARLVFPEGTVGSRFDCLARMSLWKFGLDYNHGTGHGVGHFLNVHEGPQGISFRKRDNEAGFYAGMTCSNEPGYYENGNCGMRIENICVTVPVKTPYTFSDKKFIGFETVTTAPIKTSLIQVSLMDDAEIEWLNDYHATVRERLTPLMQEYFPESIEYMMAETAPISRSP